MASGRLQLHHAVYLLPSFESLQRQPTCKIEAAARNFGGGLLHQEVIITKHGYDRDIVGIR